MNGILLAAAVPVSIVTVICYVVAGVVALVQLRARRRNAPTRHRITYRTLEDVGL